MHSDDLPIYPMPAKGLRPHGRTQKGMEEMIAAYLAAQQEL